MNQQQESSWGRFKKWAGRSTMGALAGLAGLSAAMMMATSNQTANELFFGTKRSAYPQIPEQWQNLPKGFDCWMPRSKKIRVQEFLKQIRSELVKKYAVELKSTDKIKDLSSKIMVPRNSSNPKDFEKVYHSNLRVLSTALSGPEGERGNVIRAFVHFLDVFSQRISSI